MDLLDGLAGQLIASWLAGLGLGVLFRALTNIFEAIFYTERD